MSFLGAPLSRFHQRFLDHEYIIYTMYIFFPVKTTTFGLARFAKRTNFKHLRDLNQSMTAILEHKKHECEWSKIRMKSIYIPTQLQFIKRALNAPSVTLCNIATKLSFLFFLRKQLLVCKFFYPNTGFCSKTHFHFLTTTNTNSYCIWDIKIPQFVII